MARTRSAEHSRHSPKKISVEDIANGTARLQEVLTAINDFSQEGFPYRDAARTKAELQLRECVKQIFGERSQEFHTYQHCTLRTSNGAETAQSITSVKRLLLILEEKKLELQGLKPPPSMPVSPGTGKVSPVSTAQMRLVPPASSTTMAPQPAHATVPTSVSVTMATSLPPIPPIPAAAASPPPTPVSDPPIPPISTQSIPKMPVQPAATGQFPKPQAPQPPPSAPASEPVATIPPAPPIAPSLSILTPPPVSSPASSVAVYHETMAAPTQQIVPEPVPRLSQSSTQPVAIQTAQHGSVAQPLSEPETRHLIRKVCLRLHAVARQLRLRTNSRPTIEIEDDQDLVDLLRALLRLEFDEVGTDEWTPPYSSGTPKTTLLLSSERIAIVAKKTRPGLTDKELAEQVAADSGYYSAHNKCTTLFCFVYDPEGRIGSPKRLEKDVTNVSDRYTVEILVAPK
ncbi:MAG TPA: hypothetical protein VFX56_13280 [Nitrospira sp.]|nr:hypothetical protein [Nitrospira sp.]